MRQKNEVDEVTRVFVVNFERISHIILIFALITFFDQVKYRLGFKIWHYLWAANNQRKINILFQKSATNLIDGFVSKLHLLQNFLPPTGLIYESLCLIFHPFWIVKLDIVLVLTTIVVCFPDWRLKWEVPFDDIIIVFTEDVPTRKFSII